MERPGGHAGRAHEGDRLGRHSRRVALELERHELLVAGLQHLPSVRGRVGAHLALGAVDGERHGGEATAALGQGLLAQRAVGGSEQLVDPERLEARDPERHAWLGGHARVGGEQHRELVLERDLEGIALHRARVRAAGRRLGRERDGPGRGGLLGGDLERSLERGLGVAPPGAACRGEAPRAAQAHAHADPLALVRVELVQPAVPRRQPLSPRAHEAGVGIVGASGGGVDQVAEEVAHAGRMYPR